MTGYHALSLIVVYVIQVALIVRKNSSNILFLLLNALAYSDSTQEDLSRHN